MTRPLPRHPAVPHARGFDSSLAFLFEGYGFMPRRHQALASDAFHTRLMLRPVLCVRGEDAARMFYQPGRFTRRGALPATAVALLQDFGSVMTLDGDAHRRRKAMFMAQLGPLERQRLVALAAAEWRNRFARWPGQRRLVVHEEAQQVLCRAVCHWAGIPVDEAEAAQRAAEFSKMVAAAGSVGPRNWLAQVVRGRTEQWACALIDFVRAGDITPPPDSALHAVANHRDADGQLMARKDAAIELINFLRPTVAVARYIVFGLLALHEHPHCRARIAAGDDAYLTCFVQEVRRYYPFIPCMGGRALHDFDWHELRVKKGTWVLFDLYGTNHDPALWRDPQTFRPERFAHWQGSGFDLVAQGGGDAYSGHRCPGEALTIELVKSALQLFASRIAYEVPPQDLRISLRRMPTLPGSGFAIENVRRLD